MESGEASALPGGGVGDAKRADLSRNSKPACPMSNGTSKPVRTISNKRKYRVVFLSSIVSILLTGEQLLCSSGTQQFARGGVYLFDLNLRYAFTKHKSLRR